MGDIGYGMSGSYWRQLQVASHLGGARFTGRLECATSSQGSTRFCVARVVRPWRSTQSCLPSSPSASSLRSAFSRARSPARSTRFRPRSRPRSIAGSSPASSSCSMYDERGAGSAPLSVSGGPCCRDGRRVPPDISQPARRRGPRAHRRRDPERRRGRPARAGRRRDGDRAAHAPACPTESFRGHFNVLRGYVAPLALAGVKVVGDYVDNYQRGLPSEMGLLTLFDPRTGVPLAVIDAAGLTDMRTGAVTALGARYLARKDSACLGTSARAAPRTGTCACSPACSTSTRFAFTRGGPNPRRFRARSSRRLRAYVRAPTTGSPCVRGADIVVEASRLSGPSRCCAPRGSSRRLVVPYGTMSAVELSLTDIMDKLVVDDWGQCRTGPFGSLRAHVEAGMLSRGDAACRARRDRRRSQARPRARRRDDPLLASRTVALSDIALGTRHAREGGAAGHRPAPALRLRAGVRGGGEVGEKSGSLGALDTVVAMERQLYAA